LRQRGADEGDLLIAEFDLTKNVAGLRLGPLVRERIVVYRDKLTLWLGRPLLRFCYLAKCIMKAFSVHRFLPRRPRNHIDATIDATPILVVAVDRLLMKFLFC